MTFLVSKLPVSSALCINASETRQYRLVWCAVCFVEETAGKLNHMSALEVFFGLMRDHLQGDTPRTADVLSAEVHRSNLGNTVAGGQMPTRRVYD